VSVLQLVYNADSIATVSTVIIETMPNTSKSTRTTITLKEKLSSKNSCDNIKVVHVESQAAQKNIVNVIRLGSSVEISASVLSVRIMSLSAIKRSSLTSKGTLPQHLTRDLPYVLFSFY